MRSDGRPSMGILLHREVVSFAGVRSKRAMNCMALNTRRGSSAKAGPTWRRILRLQVLLAVVRIEQFPLERVKAESVDSEVPAFGCELEGEVRIDFHGEALMPGSSFAFRAGKRYFNRQSFDLENSE